MVILGIDSSTTSTGWGVIDTKFSDELRLIDYGSIKPPKQLETIDRVIYISKELKRILQDFRPELIVIEEMNVTRNMKTIRALAGLLTEIEVMLRNRNALYIKMTPSEWRKKVGIQCILLVYTLLKKFYPVAKTFLCFHRNTQSLRIGVYVFYIF